MGIIFRKYLSFISIVLLLGVIQVHANAIFNSNGHSFSCALELAKDTSLNTTANKLSFNPLPENYHDFFFFDIAKIEDIENEESSSDSSFYLANSETIAYINAKVFRDLSYRLQEDVCRFKYHFKVPSVRVHISHQVFII